MPYLKQNQCGNSRFTLATFTIAYSFFLLTNVNDHALYFMSYTMWPKVYGQYNYLFHFQFILKVLDGVEMQASHVFPFQTGEIISS